MERLFGVNQPNISLSVPVNGFLPLNEYSSTSAMGDVLVQDKGHFGGKPPLSCTKTFPMALLQVSCFSDLEKRLLTITRGRGEVLEQTRVKIVNAKFPSFRSPDT